MDAPKYIKRISTKDTACMYEVSRCFLAPYIVPVLLQPPKEDNLLSKDGTERLSQIKCP